MDTGVLQESGVDGGPDAQYNGFFQVYALGCTTDYVEQGNTVKNQTSLGGQGFFGDTSLLPNSEILAEHTIVGQNRVLTAARPIDFHDDSVNPRVLTTKDSGKIFTNRGATGDVTFQLPAASQNVSLEYEFHLSDPGNRIRVLPATGDIIRPGQGTTATPYVSDTVYGQVLKLRNIDGTTWSVLVELGTWT